MRRALEVLREAVDCLSASKGHSRDCLQDAIRGVCQLKPTQFPPELQPNFVKLLDDVGYDRKLAWKADSDRLEDVRRRIAEIHNGDCIRLTYSVIKLENELEHYLRDK
jgi:hypothetical protein